MAPARLFGLAILFFFMTLARAADWSAVYPQVRSFYPEADAFGEFEGSPPSAAVYKNGLTIGYVYLTSDVLRIPAYSGKPINTLVGLDAAGRIVGLTIVNHDEPILAVGISQERLARYVDQYVSRSAFDKIVIGARREGHVAIDGITGATITVMVQNSTLMRSARAVAESRGIQYLASAPRPLQQGTAAAPAETGTQAKAAPAATPSPDLPQPAPEQARRTLRQGEHADKAGPGAGRPPAVRTPATPSAPTSAFAIPPPAFTPGAAHSAQPGEWMAPEQEPEWIAIWKSRTFDIAVLGGGLAVLFSILIFQDWLVRHTTLLQYLRNAFHVYTLVFIGWWGLAQLSVINVLTFVSSVMQGFRWENFLIDPMLFILWGFVAVTLLLWGRGVYCGWLCPFGALQELILIASRKLKLPQLEFSDAVHERLVALKYIILILLFGVSLQSIAEAASYTEVEPFKTVFSLRFQREWSYVLYAVLLIAIAAVNRKFYCKYLCPLGAALSIPGRFRLFEWWLRRRRECGKPCQVCANQCSVRAIRPTGEINANECHYCLDCQVIYYNDKVCLPLIDRRKRREPNSGRARDSKPATSDKNPVAAETSGEPE